MSQWYYTNSHNERQGPVDAGVIRDKFAKGELTANTLVWREGMAEWQSLPAVQALVGAGPPPLSGHIETAAAAGAEASPPASGVNEEPASPYTAPASMASADTGTAVDSGIVYAGFWRRLAAFLADAVIINMVSGIIGMMFRIGTFKGPGDAAMGGSVHYSGAELLLPMALAAIYFTWFHASGHMASPGKMAVGIKVVRPRGERLTFARAFGRWAGVVLSGFILTVGCLMAAFTGRKQALHDMMCDTLVVDKWAFTRTPKLQGKATGRTVLLILAAPLVPFMPVIGIVAIVAIVTALARS